MSLPRIHRIRRCEWPRPMMRPGAMHFVNCFSSTIIGFPACSQSRDLIVTTLNESRRQPDAHNLLQR
eukprot:91158-Prymnesium_polylepis.1